MVRWVIDLDTINCKNEPTYYISYSLTYNFEQSQYNYETL